MQTVKTKYLRVVTVPVMPLGNFRSLPAQVGSPYPSSPVIPSRPVEHPQQMSTTAGPAAPELVPASGSILAPSHPA